jgi:energy-converting hydrogenase Eha subunit E
MCTVLLIVCTVCVLNVYCTAVLFVLFLCTVLLYFVYCLCWNVYCTAVLCVLFLCKCVLYCCILCTVCVEMCAALLPPGVNPIAIKKYIVSCVCVCVCVCVFCYNKRLCLITNYDHLYISKINGFLFPLNLQSFAWLATFHLDLLQAILIIAVQLPAAVFLVTCFKYYSRGLPTACFPDIAPSKMLTTNSLHIITCHIHEWRLFFVNF